MTSIREIVLGHIISREGIEVDEAKVDLITDFPLPTCVKAYVPFFGHTDFYRRFIRNFSKIVKPLSSFLVKNVPLHFSRECDVAFTKLKEALTNTSILHPPV